MPNTQTNKSYIVAKIPLNSGTQKIATKNKPINRKLKTAILAVIAVFTMFSASVMGYAIGVNNRTEPYNPADNPAELMQTTTIDTAITLSQSPNNVVHNAESEDIETTPAETIPIETEPGQIVDSRLNMFDENITFRINHIISPNKMPYTLISPMENGKVIDDKPLPLIVWLHGSGEKSVEPAVFLNNGLPPVFQNWTLDGFRAYIICPQLDGKYNPGAWYIEQSATNLNNLLTDFIAEHNIDTNHIVIMGHSLGGQGALYMAHHFNGDKYPALFEKCVTLSPYSPVRSADDPVDIKEIKIPVRAYVGMHNTGEDLTSVRYALGTLAPVIGEKSVISLPTGHGDLPYHAFNLDKDDNDRPDIIEWCFDTNDDNKLDDFITVVDYSTNIADTKSAHGVYDSIPLYFQTDYPDVDYSQGSLATSGCGMTCFSMVATWLLDEEYTPDELARFTGSGSDNATRFEKAAESLGIEWEKMYIWSDIIDALKQGKVAIVLVNDETPFTSGGHFIVLTGITADGKILVNDPNEANYRRMKYEFEHGFNQDDIREGCSGAWVFDKNK